MNHTCSPGSMQTNPSKYVVYSLNMKKADRLYSTIVNGECLSKDEHCLGSYAVF